MSYYNQEAKMIIPLASGGKTKTNKIISYEKTVAYYFRIILFRIRILARDRV